MTTVNVELKFVRNLGNYESAHLTVGVTDSVRDGESADQAFKRVYKFVEDKLEEKIHEIDREHKSR